MAVVMKFHINYGLCPLASRPLFFKHMLRPKVVRFPIRTASHCYSHIYLDSYPTLCSSQLQQRLLFLVLVVVDVRLS